MLKFLQRRFFGAEFGRSYPVSDALTFYAIEGRDGAAVRFRGAGCTFFSRLDRAELETLLHAAQTLNATESPSS